MDGMDRAEALAVADGIAEELRRVPYEALVARLLDAVETRDVAGASGTEYQIEVQGFWDRARRPGNLRVMVSVDDGGLRAFAPLTTDFIMAPDGSFVGEG
jgi:hypothetical protein